MPCAGARFRPVPNETIVLGSRSYTVQPHPRAPGSPFSAEGRRAVVYGLRGSGDQPFAFKVFKKAYRSAALLESAALLTRFASFPGMLAAKRTVVGAQDPVAVDCPDLAYSTLMPWIPGSTWNDILIAAERGRPNYALDVGLRLCGRFLEVMEGLEKAGAAHTDIAPGNVTISVQTIDVQLIDLEDLYVPGIPQPPVRNTGTAGYRHPGADRGETTWCAEGDRFAVAVMAAEMLILTNPILGKQASDTGYFDGDRATATGAQRFEAAYPFLRSVAPDFAELFYAAWLSPALGACPPASVLRNALAAAPAPPRPIPGVAWEAYAPPVPPKAKAATAAQGGNSAFWEQQPQGPATPSPNAPLAGTHSGSAQKNRAGKRVALAIVLVLVLGTIGAVSYQNYQAEQQKQEEQKQEKQNAAARAEAARLAEEETARQKAAQKNRLSAPRATIGPLRIDYEVMEGNERGMRVHLDFTVANLMNRECQAALYFYFDDGTTEGEPIINPEAQCKTVGTKQLCGVAEFTPDLQEKKYDDLQIFVPDKDIFSVSGDRSKFKVRAEIRLTSGDLLGTSDWSSFGVQKTP